MTAAAARAQPPWKRGVKTAASLALVALIFFWGLPQIADFSEVWAAIRDLSWLEILTLLVAAAWNIATYMFVAMSVLPGLTFTQAFVVGQSSTAVSTSLPAGSALGIGVTYAMYSSWGRSGPEIALAAVLSGLWNTFVKLGLPIVALALLAVQGPLRAGETLAALTGLAVLAGAVVLFALVLHSPHFAERIGNRLGAIVSRCKGWVRRPPVTGWGEGAVRFRAETIDLLRQRWRALTVATLVSHLSLYVVLLLALRHMGVSDSQVSWAEALGAFAFIRLVTALPVTPGGLGLVELGLVAALVLAGGQQAPVVAAVLIFRFLTLILQVPIGGVSYAAWRLHMRRTAARRAPEADHVTV